MNRRIPVRVVLDVFYEGSELIREELWDYMGVAFEKNMELMWPQHHGEIVDIGLCEPFLVPVYSPDNEGNGQGIVRFVLTSETWSEYVALCRAATRHGFRAYLLSCEEHFWDLTEQM